MTSTYDIGVPFTADASVSPFVQLSLSEGPAATLLGEGLFQVGATSVGFTASPAEGFAIRRFDVYVGAQGSYSADSPMTLSKLTAEMDGTWIGNEFSVTVPALPAPSPADAAIFMTICEADADFPSF